MLNPGCERARRAIVMVVAVCVALWAAAAIAQTPSLAELARKEQERRKTQKTPSKVITKKDLPPDAQGRGNTPPASRPTALDETKPTETKSAEEQKDETWWKNRITQVREELRRNEMFAEALQTRINALSADFVNRDDPFQRGRIGVDRDKAISELARVKGEIERAKKQIEDIEEEARKAGVPPGWVR
jgi:hypothetical protein